MKLNGFDLNKIHVFVSVVKHQGYRGASEELQLTRSAISQSISTLENTLGISLFHRVGRRLVPTPPAMRFFEEVSLYQQGLQESVATLVGEKGRVEGVLRIGTYLEFAKSKMMPVVEEFLGRNPGAQIKFVFESPSRLKTLLESGKTDLSISVFPHLAQKKIFSRKLYQEELVLIGMPELIAERPKRSQLLSVPVIDYFPSHLVFKRWWRLHFGSGVFRGQVRCYAASPDMVLEMAKRGLGVGVVPRYVYEASDSSSMLQVIQPTAKRLYDYVWMSENALAPRSLVQQSFCDLLAARFRAKLSRDRYLV